VVGNSMGGYLTMRAALEAPERFVAIVDVHGPAFPLLRLRALDAAMAIPGARAALAHLIARDPERWVHRNVHYFDESTKSLEEARIYGEPLKTSAGRAAFVSWLVDGLDPRELDAFAAKLRALGGVFPVPLALLYARTDPMVPPEVGLRLAELFPHAEHAWLEGSSHFAHVDTPRAFVAALRPFLRAHAG
jgi:pimeloyl-ACP methyl ester carboxylesterase